MSNLPPLFTCSVCGLSLRPGDSTVERKAIVWLKAKGKTLNKVVEELHEYKHEFCSPKEPPRDIPLF